MPVLHTSFSNRVTGYFGALFMLAMGIMFSLWYFGLPQWGLNGASHQHLSEAMRILEIKADFHRTLIDNGIKERRGDVLIIAENRTIAEQLSDGNPAIQQDLTRVFERLQRAYPDRYQQLYIVDPASKLIRASSEASDLGHSFNDPELIGRAAQTGATEIITQLKVANGATAFTIARQIQAPDADGYPNGKLLGILIAYVNLQHIAGEGFQTETSNFDMQGTSLLFDSSGQVLARFPITTAEKNSFNLNSQVAPGFEGTLLETNANGKELVVVYRHLQLSGAQAWTLVHYASKEAALKDIKERANNLILIGFLLTLVALILINLAARRLTRPLHLLSRAARQLGTGDLSVRALARPQDSREIVALSVAFNGMAEGIQKVQHTLEAKVLERTAELAGERDKAQDYLDIAGVMLMALDVNGRITMINKKGQQLLGQAENGLIGIDWFDHFIPPDQRTAARQTFQLFMSGATQAMVSYENGILNTHGQQRILSWSNALMRDKAGTVVGMLSSGKDITDRTEAEATLKESEQRYRTLIEWSPEPINVQRDGKMIYVNPAAITMFGAKSAQDLLGKTMLDLVHPDFHQIALVRAKNVINHGAGAPMVEMRLLKLDGTVIDVEIEGTSIVYDGAPAIHVIMRNISQRKRAEEDLRIAAIAFESQEGMYITNADWVILRVNRAFTEITGYSSEQAVGQTPQLLRSSRHDAAFFRTITESLECTGSWQGEIWDRRQQGEVFPEWLAITVVKDDMGRMTHYVGTFTDITQRKTAEEKIKNLAFFDPLTGLPNRRLLMDRLEQALAGGTRHQRKGALLFVDLDDFKTLNDTLGHDKGDLLLQQVATRLTTCIRDGDTVARLGGDEFVVMLEDLSENMLEAATQAETVGEKILTTLNQVYQLASHEHHSTPSIGVTLFGERQENIDEPLKRADLAMYQAKAAGRNTLRFFDPRMQAVVTARAALELGLREALVKNQFCLHYQAQVTSEHWLTGAEVLVRWQHPQRGMVSPAEFIPLAEETGLITAIGHWVLGSACTQLAIWARQPEMAHLTIAVNVSPRQFNQRDFVNQVLTILEYTGANPEKLKLELTEGLLVSNVEDVIIKMRTLKEKGIGFSLDDFGTGYSSLSYLKRLPLDQLKIDQSFVRDILIDSNDAAIAKMVIALANSLGLAVIAEGVETEAQRDYLANQGCHAYQGYLFSRPLPLQEFESLVKRGQSPLYEPQV